MTDVIEAVVAEHLAEASFLWLQRDAAVDAPNYSPEQFADLDERLEAHVDGLRVAGEDAWRLAWPSMAEGAAEDVFAPSVLAIERQDSAFDEIVRRAEEAPEIVPAVISALGWAEPVLLSGRVKSLLLDASPVRQMLGIAACGVHRKDPGPVLDKALASNAATVRARALRTVGELGRLDLLGSVQAALADDKQDARYWAARSAVLLGDRGRAVTQLQALACAPGRRQRSAVELGAQVLDMPAGHEWLQQIGGVADADRWRIIAAGLLGNVRYVPWLIDQMSNPTMARVAAEAFVNLTGADFNTEQLEELPPEQFEEGPSDDPADENVDVPEDYFLPWPAVARVKTWWERHQSRFDTATRYFLGMPVTPASCLHVLRTGFQRQRVAAARFRCLLQPGTPLFNTSTVARRQQELLSALQ